MSGRVEVNGTILNTRIDGEEGAPWIVLSNSLAATLDMWQPQVDLLARRYRVLRYDTRGHGGSDAPAGDYSFADLVGDVIGLMDRFGIERAAYMGLSLGGMTGLGLALAHPERVERLVCCDARADAPPPFIASWDDRVAAIRAGGMAAIAEPTLERWFSGRFRTDRPAEVAHARRMILSTDVEGYAGCAAALKRLDYLQHLPGMTVPTLFVVGEEDSGAPPPVMQAMAAATPGSAFRSVAGAAHIANMDNPTGFAEAISPFLDLP